MSSDFSHCLVTQVKQTEQRIKSHTPFPQESLKACSMPVVFLCNGGCGGVGVSGGGGLLGELIAMLGVKS